MKCPTCKRAKCRWVELKADPSKLSTEELEKVMNHNIDYIEMVSKGMTSSYAEERLYERLAPYAHELERRRK